MSSQPEVRSPRRFPFLKSFPVDVQRVQAAPQDHLMGQVVGTVNGSRIIVSGIAAGALSPGEEVTVRMTVGGKVLGFQTQVQEASGVIAPLFLLAMPEKVESINPRKGERMNLFVPADVQYSQGKANGQSAVDLALVQGRMLNLSREGCCLSTKRPLTLNQPIRLAFALPGARNTYRLPAQVLRHFGPPREGVFVQGVRFEKHTEHLPALADLQQWIAQNLPYALPN